VTTALQYQAADMKVARLTDMMKAANSVSSVGVSAR